MLKLTIFVCVLFFVKGQEFEVPETIPQLLPKVQNCQPSVTVINGGESTCANQLLFEDTFTNPHLDEHKWLKEQYVAWSPDFEFVSYERRAENCFIKENNLNFKTTIRENPFVKQVDLTDGCTRTQCVATGTSTIAPPIVSAKVTSKFSFCYGKIEIGAKLPIGDWIYPQLYLEAKNPYIYGEGYGSGRILVAYARGNRDLVHTSSGRQIGNTVLYGGPILTKDEPNRSQFLTTVRNHVPWGLNFYTFTIIWTPDDISFAVNGETKGTAKGPYKFYMPTTSRTPANVAPFDVEFVITMGLGVGGSSDFPDGTTSNGMNKPWRKTQAKSTLLFYQANHTWYPTWNENDSALKIESVRVWSL